MRVPGARYRNFSRSLNMLPGSRKSPSTDAFEMSAAYMSPWTNCAVSATPAAAALRLESSTMLRLYSTPSARAPRLAAAITMRPSPEPRSIRKSCGVSCARSSIFSTSAGGVGTHTTSFPGCPTSGSKGLASCAETVAARRIRHVAAMSAAKRGRIDGVLLVADRGRIITAAASGGEALEGPRRQASGLRAVQGFSIQEA